MEPNNQNNSNIEDFLKKIFAKQLGEKQPTKGLRQLDRRLIAQKVAKQLHQIEQNFRWTKESKALFITLLNYFCRHADLMSSSSFTGVPSFKKGIYLFGKPGSGKTTMIEAFRRVLVTIPKVGQDDFDDFRFMKYHWESLLGKLKTEGGGPLINNYGISGANGYDKNRPLSYWFDEWSPKYNLKDFGSPVDLDDIFLLRYGHYEAIGARTFITTNIFPDQLPSFLPHKVLSRFRGMFNFIPHGVGADYIDFRLTK
jgi:hypothetical protein